MLLASYFLFIAGITVLHVVLNEGGLPFGSAAAAKFRVGFLPVT
jgi:hypothetical protein